METIRDLHKDAMCCPQKWSQLALHGQQSKTSQNVHVLITGIFYLIQQAESSQKH
jgi:hypothetical protein